MFFPFRSAGWTFRTGSNLEGSFNLTGFEASGSSDRVGANLSLNYIPAGNDPVNNDQTELHWIQRVISNNNVTDNEGYGNPEDTIDVPDRSLPYTDPGRLFYDYKLGFPTPPSFQDGPDRVQVDGSNKWRAELYLASFSRSDPYNVTIYNGISWGWKNEPVVDFTFVVDTTGSMGNYIGTAQATMNQFLNRLETVGVDYRVAIADFKDFPSDSSPNDYPYLAALPFTSDRTSIINTVSALGGIIGGGGDTPESSYSALIRAMRTENLGPWRSGAEKIMFLITDAPPHDPELFTGYTLQDVISEAAIQDKVRIFSQIPGGNSSAVSYFSSLSSRTNGNSCTTEESCAAILFALLGSLTTPSGNGGGSNIRDITSHADNHLTPHQLLPKAVPEPSATVGIIAVSAIGWLIRRKRVLIKSV